MIGELVTYQREPCRATLEDFWIAIEPRIRTVARGVLMKMGRIQDDWLLTAMVQESALRITKAAKTRLLTLRPNSELKLTAYIDKLAKGAAYTAADSPICGATRRNLKRRKSEVKPWERTKPIPWPDKADGCTTATGSEIPDTGQWVFSHFDACTWTICYTRVAGTADLTSYSFTNHDGPRQAATPEWSHANDRGDEWWRFVTWIATAAKYTADGWALLAVNQILSGRTDREQAAMMNIARSTWQERKHEALRALAPRIVTASDYEMDALGEKLLGDLWIRAAKRREVGVLHRESDRAA